MLVIDENLFEILPHIEQSDRIAMDTEADSIHCYPEKLCLIQLSTDKYHVLIDPLKNLNLDSLWKILKNKTIVLHAADYDIRLLYKRYGFVPSKIFDTMYGARLLGHKQFGLSDLVKKYFGVKLEKSHQKANWTTRPIPQHLLEYAINDTRYLLRLAEILQTELQQTNRIHWHSETCEKLIARIIDSINLNHDDEWRLPGSKNLSSLGLSVLKEIWLWRENEAVSSSKPPFFILPHNQLISIAEAAACSEDFTAFFPKNCSPKKISALTEAIQRGLKTPSEKRPVQIKNNGDHFPLKKIRFFNKMMKYRNNLASNLKIDPSLIASRAELIEITKNPEKAPTVLMNWQFELLKNAISDKDV
ncbi:MAG: HRDC domain-containing protein [Verrucomicrobiae bacterium]|nr:HRDC domain-containing protein [Verrucomicrobiae bacterium]